jgi:hypothetical protein
LKPVQHIGLYGGAREATARITLWMAAVTYSETLQEFQFNNQMGSKT